MNKKLSVFRVFWIPILVLLSIPIALGLKHFFPATVWSDGILLGAIAIGSFELLKETVSKVLHGQFALDYIALLAIITGVGTHQYLVAAVIVLMLAGGNTLEEYGMMLAKQSLTTLANRIPHIVQVLHGKELQRMAIEKVMVGMKILVRKGEVVALDGTIESEQAVIDESSLTGEPYPVDKVAGDLVRSGTVNVGDVMTLKVTKADRDSTYRKIIQMVQEAQLDKSPLIRLADKYSGVFTIVTFVIAGLAFLVSQDFNRVLSVLVIATPCPLILATPIALMGGMNAAAKKRIVMKKLSSIEVLSRVKAIIFDKTGTITLGKPLVTEVKIFDADMSRAQALALAGGLERNSLHPLAKAIMELVRKEKISPLTMNSVVEKIGHGISGKHQGKEYSLTKSVSGQGMEIELVQHGQHGKHGRKIASLHFEDELKKDSAQVLTHLQEWGLQLHIFTGDHLTRAKELVQQLGKTAQVELKADCSPEDKREGIAALKKKGLVTAMVGDGINDAPALALADVGIVFSNEEHTASSEAADIVLLGGDFGSVLKALTISQQTIHIAMQSIFVGIGLSVAGMVLASFGFVPPVVGAGIQELIDVAVIINALRASRI